MSRRITQINEIFQKAIPPTNKPIRDNKTPIHSNYTNLMHTYTHRPEVHNTYIGIDHTLHLAADDRMNSAAAALGLSQGQRAQRRGGSGGSGGSGVYTRQFAANGFDRLALLVVCVCFNYAVAAKVFVIDARTRRSSRIARN